MKEHIGKTNFSEENLYVIKVSMQGHENNKEHIGKTNFSEGRKSVCDKGLYARP
jgi:hypothetical protein